MSTSKTKIDHLGERLRRGEPSEADLRMLDEYRRSFDEAYDVVINVIKKQLNLEPTGRRAKTTASIVEKLHRESARLSQIQDIAGCRLVVGDMIEQDAVVQSLLERLDACTIVDRREKPSHGYRAVHVIASVSGRLVEIQVRTELQHLWAEISQKLSDVYDPSIKYGGGDPVLRAPLDGKSGSIAAVERVERAVPTLPDIAEKRSLVEQLRGLREDLRIDLRSWIEELQWEEESR